MSNTECFICGDDRPNSIETHHIVPRRYGGSDRDENLVDLCASCHSAIEKLYDDRFYQALGVESPADTGSVIYNQLHDGQEISNEDILYDERKCKFYRANISDRNYGPPKDKKLTLTEINDEPVTGEVSHTGFKRKHPRDDPISKGCIYKVTVDGPLIQTLMKELEYGSGPVQG